MADLDDSIIEEQNEGKFRSKPSSLELSSCLYYDYYYTWVIVIITFILQIYKVSLLPFPGGVIANEIVMLVFYALLSFGRIAAGWNANRIESYKMIFFQMVCSISVVGNAFFMEL